MKRFVISDLQYYHEYKEIARYDPFIIRVEGNDKNNKDDEYIEEASPNDGKEVSRLSGIWWYRLVVNKTR